MKLIKINKENYQLLYNMMDEWTKINEKIVPYSIRKEDYRDYNKYIKSFENNNLNENEVPSTTYFALDEENNRFLGAVNIRHYLNDNLLKNGGHIGYGVRPSERRKGYCTQILKLALEKCIELNIQKALLVCDKSNLGSAGAIKNNGGILENEIELVKGEIDQRYWINI